MVPISPLHLISLFSILTALATAAPIEPEPLHSLKLRKIPTRRDGEHPVQAFERHQRAAIKRLHNFKRLPQPDEDFFRKRALQRRQMIEDNPKLDNRMWIPTVSPADVVANQKASEEKRAYWRPTASSLASGTPTPLSQLGDTQPNQLKKGQGSATVAAAAAAAATTTIAASGSNANGFGKAALAALNDGTLLKSSSSLIEGGLDYIIESNDIGYLCEIDLGTPPQTFLMLMDTGSADTWVPSTQCGQQNCGTHTTLGSENSNTFQASTQQFQVTYGSGAVAGVLAADTMTIAGLTLENHVMGVTLQESVQFSGANIPFDGLMGLALSKLSNQGVSTPIESLATTGVLKNAVLGIALGRVDDGENNGELVFGQADASKIDATTTQTLPVTSTNGFWEVAMEAVSVDGTAAVTGRQAILDTGTSLMIAPEADALAFHSQINGAADVGNGMFSIPCTIDQEVTMTFGNVAFQLDVRDLLFQPLTNDLTGDCLSSLSAGTIIDDVTWLLGDSFLKNVYMTTNVEDETVQLSARTDVPGSSSATNNADAAGAAAAAAATTGANSTVSASAVKVAASSSSSSSAAAASATSGISLLGALAALLAGGGNL